MSVSIEDQTWTRSLKGLVVVQLFLGYVFLISGLLVNFLQFLSACFIWPFNRALYRKINYHLATIIWSRKFSKQKKDLYLIIIYIYRNDICLSMVVSCLSFLIKKYCMLHFAFLLIKNVTYFFFVSLGPIQM
jgi:hypothetical protein